MIKDEPNPEFLKHQNLPKIDSQLTESFENIQTFQFNAQNSKIFDFGISDDEWGKTKKNPANHKENNQKENSNSINLPNSNNFQTFSLQSSDNLNIHQKKQKLQEFYLLSKKRNNKNQGKQTQLQQLIKFNKQTFSVSSTSKRPQLYSTEEDFFSMAQNQEKDETDFQVFDKAGGFSSSSKKYSKSSDEQFIQNEKTAQNEICYFQTQSLLENDESSTRTKAKVFSIKFMESSLCNVKLGIHLISITTISIMYGFWGSIILLILHDFGQFLFVLIEMVLKYQSQTTQNKPEENKLFQMPDQIQQTRDVIQDKRIFSYVKQESNIRRLIRFHKLFKYSLYVSSMSLFGFIIVHITQIDTFFTANYFSFMNWSPIITLVGILFAEGWWNIKLAKRIDEILFYENSVLEDIKTLNQKERVDHERGLYGENLWEA